jgi:hypothetical protein
VRVDRHLDKVSARDVTGHLTPWPARAARCSVVAALAALAALAAFAALGALSQPLAAQRIRGQVLLPDSATPARGIIVVASDTLGRPLTGVLTSERGDFEMPLPAAGRFDIRALRIGYRPTLLSAVVVGAGETRTIRIVLNGTAVTLAAVTVRGNNVCRLAQDSGQVVATLWEEARKALTASRLASSGGRLLGHWTVYDSVSKDPLGRVMATGTFRSTTGFTEQPFSSIPADSLAHEGYVQTQADGGQVYFAPDADVLLSESFAELHCFRVEPPPAGHREWVGVGFLPARMRPGITDVAGTLWLDRESAELRLLELRYAPQPREFDAVNTGATIEFLRLATGNWLVNRWAIRTPRATRTLASVSLGGRPSAQREVLSVVAVQVTGGEVTSVERGRTQVYATAQPSRARPLVPGDSVHTPDSAALLPSCDGADVGLGKALLHGVVFQGARTGVVGAAISVTWKYGFAVAGQGAFSWRTRKADTTSGNGGAWFLCGLPRDTRLTLEASHAGRKASFEVFIPSERAVATVDVELPGRIAP